MPSKNNNELSDLPWHIVEQAINKEIQWLKESIPVRNQGEFFDSLEGRNLKCDNCDYIYRKIALLIITGKLKAREIVAKNNHDLWDDLTKTINEPTKYKYHGKEWHRKIMEAIDHFFGSQGYNVTTEPCLNNGRADLGIYMGKKKHLFVEVGTTSIYKLWINLKTIRDSVFLIIPSEDKIIEFET